MKKKILNKELLLNKSVKNLKAHIISLSIVAVLGVLLICWSYIYQKVYTQNIFIQIFAWLFVAFILGTIIHTIIQSSKKMKIAKSEKKEYTIVDTYLLQRKIRESADEHGDADVLMFWCGETYGMVEAFHSGDPGIKGRKIGNPCYVAVRFAPKKNCYVGDWCFSKSKYELDDDLKNKVVQISYEEFEKQANRLKIKVKK